jgi:beta-hydroxylase
VEGAASVRDRVRTRRRRLVKRHGKRAIRRLASFLGRQSRVGDPPVFDVETFPWARDLELDWRLVRDEAARVLARRRELPSFPQISPDQSRIANDDWKIFFFYAFGYKDDDALADCPETARLLATIPRLETAFFSILPPRIHVRTHRGVTKAVVRGHLALIVPGEPGACRMRIGDEVRHWEPGRLLVFDDTVPHEVWNDTDEHRVVLLFDFRRPMRLPGELLAAAFIRGLRLTRYVRDGLANHAAWKAEFRR